MITNTTANTNIQLSSLIESLQSLQIDDSLDLSGIAKMVKEAMNLHIEKKIIEKHVNNDGTLRKIKTPEDNRKGLWSTFTPERKEITAKSKDELMKKLYAYYFGDTPTSIKRDYTFNEIWNEAHTFYIQRHQDKHKTTQTQASDYRRFINDDLASMKISMITTDYLEQYSINLCTNSKLTAKAFAAFKGVLNLAYDYALRYPDKFCITVNPAKHIDNRLVQPKLDQSLSYRDTDDVIYSQDEINAIFAEAARRSSMSQFNGYYIYDYLIKAHYEIGCRPGELVALKWSDIISDVDGNPILHIHAQQIDKRSNYAFEYVPYTKNEKGLSKGGRYFPVTEELSILLKELRNLQKIKHIDSEFIFCDEKGEWIIAKSYIRTLKTICDKLGIPAKGTYAFRREVNNTLYAAGISDINRGRAIGNGPKTNIEHYIHARSDYAEQARIALNTRNQSRSIQVQTM